VSCPKIAFFALIAVIALAARANAEKLNTPALALIALGAVTFFGYYLFVGFKTGTMEAPGVGYLAGRRDANRVLYWFCTLFNAFMFVGAIALFVMVLK